MKKSSSGTATKKKKPSSSSSSSSKRWTLASLFKRRKSKSSDTDCTSSDSECNAKNAGSFLARKRSVRGREGGSHRVVGKFESIIMPREEKPNVSDSVLLDNLEQYDASPNATKRGRFNNSRTIGALPMTVSLSNQEMTRTVSKREPEFTATTSTSTNTDSSHHGSLDTGAGKRLERQRAKARAEAFRQHLLQGAGNSSSSEDADYHTAGGGSSNNTSSKTSTSSSLQRTRSPEGSLGRKQQRSTAGSRSSDRHSKRQYREYDDLTTAAGSQKARSWDASCRLRTVRKSSSPRGPHIKPVSSYNLHDDYSVTDNGLARRSISWPDNCIRAAAAAVPPAAAAGSSSRSSAVNSLNSRTKIINSANNNAGCGGSRIQEDKLNLPRSPPPPEFRRLSGTAVRNKYSTDKKPRSRNPIQIATESKSSQTCYDDHADDFDSSYFGASENPDFNLLPPAAPPSLNTANELGIPRLTNSLEYGRPLSTVMERSDCEQSSAVSHSENDDNFNKNYSWSSSSAAAAAAKKKKPSNLEEALKELEEIYNSLRLSDDELMEAADRRDLSEAIKRNLSRCRYSWSTNLNGQIADYEEPDSVFFSGSLDCLNPSPTGTSYHRLRLTSNRRSVIPDKVEDDMAYRKLNRKPSSEPKTTSNIVSQSGSFLLVSPTWSPPPFPNLPPPPSAPPPTTPSSSGTSSPSSTNNEPDIMLDDVVYRTITQTNNSLKVADPQPPFGIPIGPVPSATESDYLHATRKERWYRSSFKPRRTPDVVQDDLAFRTLRKDLTTPAAQNGVAIATGAQQYFTPSSSRRTRAMRSLSANIESNNYLAGCSVTDCNNNRNNDNNIDNSYNCNKKKTTVADFDRTNQKKIDADSGRTNQKKTDADSDRTNQKKTDADSDRTNQKKMDVDSGRINQKKADADSGRINQKKVAPSANQENDFSAMANEAKIVSRELNEKLRLLNSAVKIQPMCRKELKDALRKFEAIPSRKKLLEDGDDHQVDLSDKNDINRRKKNELFAGKIVHHKPITLSQFSIDCDQDGLESNCSIHSAAEEPSSAVPVDKNQSLKSICDSFNWDSMKNVCASPTMYHHHPTSSNNYETYRVSCTMNVKNCTDHHPIDDNSERRDDVDQTKTDHMGNLADRKCGNLFPNRALSEASNDLIQSVDNLFRSFIPSTMSQSTTPARSYRNNSNAIVAATPARDNSSSLLTSSAGM